MTSPQTHWWTRRARNAAPVLFALALLLLVALSGWWFYFIHRAIAEQHQMQRDLLQVEAMLHAQRMAGEEGTVHHGPLPEDGRFEVVLADRWYQGLRERLAAGRDAWMPATVNATHVLVPTEAVLNDLEHVFGRRQQMVVGEGALLASLLLAVLGMLYTLVRAERRFHAEMENFLGSMTHELKTPLAGIKAVLQTLELGRMPPERLGELAGLALKEVRREEHLIQNLLVAQRMRQPDSRLVRETMDLAEMLRQFIAHRIGLAGRAAVTWELEGAAEMVVYCDTGSLRTVVDNLADNAIKYGARTVRFSLQAEGDVARLNVHDDGMGFAPERAERLFEAFVRGNSGKAAAREGTGLGLYISRTLARRMDGELRAFSDGEGKGARFELTLPLAKSGEAG